MKQFSLSTITSQLQTWNPFVRTEKLAELKKDSDKRYSDQIVKEREYAFDVKQEDLKNAIAEAEDPLDPRRSSLLTIYRETIRDLHLKSQIETAVSKVLSAGWAIVDESTFAINEDLTKLMQRKWFEKLRKLYLESEFWGFKLIELGKFKETKNGWELTNVKEFPPELVIPVKGLIVANTYAQQGIPFRPDDLPEDADKRIRQLAEDASTFFIEAGDPEFIGLLADASPNSIYKKYGKGDWARSSEKWIDPAIVQRTDSDDDDENDKKADALANFGNNSWLLTDKQDELDLLERRNGNGFRTTSEFLLYLDGENSKGVNGQKATADEKSFVGSAEVQERILDDYTERRQRGIQYWLNEEAIPKLIGLNNGNTAYSKLEGHLFMPLSLLEEKEDEPPEQPKKEPNEKVVPGKQQPLPVKNLEGDEYGLSTQIEVLYLEVCCVDHGIPSDGLTNSIGDLIQQFLKRIHDRKLKPGRIDHALARENADRVWSGLKSSFDKNLTSVKFGSPEHRLRVQLKYNVFVMAAFKNHHNTLEVFNNLFDSDGAVKTFSAFKKDVLAINEKYNVNWLRTEHKLAQANGRMASKWMVLSNKGGSIVYMAVLDGNARPEHEALHGSTYPVSHSFWQTYYPPNGWGCRCDVRWIRREETKPPENPPILKDVHRNNPGITGKVFNEYHPYFDVAQQFEKNANKIFGFKMPVDLDRFNANMAIYETLKKNTNYRLMGSTPETGGFVFRHGKYDKKDYKLNEKTAGLLARKGYAVEIKKHVTDSGDKNPELRVSGILTDLKTPSSVKGIKTAFQSARKQGLDFVVIAMSDKWNASSIQKNLDNAFFYNQEIGEALIVWKGEVRLITRRDFNEGQIPFKIK